MLEKDLPNNNHLIEDEFKRKLFNKVGYKPYSSQIEGHNATSRIKALFAGARYGKSLWEAKEVLPDIMKPNTRGSMVGPTYDQPSKEFRYIYDDVVIKLGFKPMKQLNAKFTSPGPQGLIMPWGAEVWTKSEENSNSLLGEELDWVLLSEGSRLKEATFTTFIRARLGTRMGRIVVPTTPWGFNWLWKRFYLPAQAGDPLYWSKIVKVTENLLFSMEEYETAKKELPEEIFREQYEGEFVAYTGLIYKRFSHDKNVIEPFEIPAHWVRYMSIDPDPSTPAAVLWLAVDEHGTAYLYDELFTPNLTIPEVVSHIKSKECLHFGKPADYFITNPTGYEHIYTSYKRLIDPNAKFIDKLRGQTASIQNQFRQYGMYCQEANNKFEHAFYKISELLTPKAVFGQEENLTPRMFVFNGCKEVIHEFLTCNWENEKDNHMLDNLKYIINDNPVKTYTEDELAKEREDDIEYLKAMNPLTGY